MKKIELAKRLTISIEELEKAHVSSFNKKVLTNLAYTEFTGEVDDKDVATAEDLLRSFLHETWPEEPQAHKYVIHSCLALAFLFEKPLHPQEVVQYTVREAGGREKYYCRYHEKGTICDFCAAEAEESPTPR